MVFSVVSVGISPDQSDIINEVLCAFVDIVVQFLLHSSEIHRFGDYVEVVHDVVLHWVDRLVKPEGSFKFPAVGKKFLGEFLPGYSGIAIVNFFLGD